MVLVRDFNLCISRFVLYGAFFIALHFITADGDPFCLGAYPYTELLCFLALRARIAYLITNDANVVSLTAYIYPAPIATCSVIIDPVVFQQVSVPAGILRLIAEKDSVALISYYDVVSQDIIGILVTYGYAELTVVAQFIALEQPMTHPPAEEQAV